jgi:hypothetical protein
LALGTVVGLECNGRDAVVTTKLTVSLLETSAASCNEFMERLVLDRLLSALITALSIIPPPIGIKSSNTSEARLSVCRSKNANLFHRDDGMTVKKRLITSVIQWQR